MGKGGKRDVRIGRNGKEEKGRGGKDRTIYEELGRKE